jgi:uncharacterized membrane protein
MSAELLLFAQQTMPTMDGMYWLNLLSRVLHIMGAIILVGGLIYLRTVVMPSAAAANATTVDEKFGGLRSKWAMWIGIATALLLVTGIWNLIVMFRTYELAKSYHMLLTLKILAGLALFGLAALVAGRTPAAEVIRGKMRMWVGLCIAIGVLTVALGSLMRSIPHNPKIDAAAPPTLVAPAAKN